MSTACIINPRFIEVLQILQESESRAGPWSGQLAAVNTTTYPLRRKQSMWRLLGFNTLFESRKLI